MLKSVCVFCGARYGNNPAYRQAAKEMGLYLAENEITLVYGGGNVGLMGEVADAALAAGGRVIGVIPEFLVAKEVAHQGLTELHRVETMHQRKALMAELSDAFVAMPGGFGTFEEFCEVLSWAQLGLHQKPYGLLNVAGYYSPLIDLFDKALAEGFLAADMRALVVQAPTPETLMAYLEQVEPSNRPSHLPGPL